MWNHKWFECCFFLFSCVSVCWDDEQSYIRWCAEHMCAWITYRFWFFHSISTQCNPVDVDYARQSLYVLSGVSETTADKTARSHCKPQWFFLGVLLFVRLLFVSLGIFVSMSFARARFLDTIVWLKGVERKTKALDVCRKSLKMIMYLTFCWLSLYELWW